jgi:hypothetical protein
MRLEILKQALEKGTKFFKILTCGFSDPEKFKQKYLDKNDNMSDDGDDILDPNQIKIDIDPSGLNNSGSKKKSQMEK